MYDDIAPYVDGLHFHDYDNKAELMFDPTKFKADKRLRISEETKRVLSKLPEARTDKELYYAQIALGNIQTFADYPVRMQRNIVSVAMYEIYEAKRVIVRQGHKANAFYIILSGSVVVMVSDKETKVPEPVAYLHRGMAFGELAIINRTTRQSTCIAKETLELLSIHIEDFHKIFMAGGIKNINDPDHNQFIKGVGFLKGWPLEKMAENPNKCIFHYFRRGDILVKDSNYSDWIYIVKSGSLRILKKLRKVRPFGWKRKDYQEPHRKSTNDEEIEAILRENQRRYVLSELNVPLRSTTQLRDQDVSGYTDGEHGFRGENVPETRRAIGVDGRIYNNNSSVVGRESPCMGIPPDSGDSLCSTPRLGRPNKVLASLFNRRNKTLSAKFASQNHSMPLHSQTLSQKSLPNVLTAKNQNTTSTLLTRGSVKTTSSPGYVNMAMTSSSGGHSGDTSVEKSSGKESRRNTDKYQAELEEEMQGRKQQIRTITDDFNAACNKKSSEVTEADLNPEFVQIQILTKGQTFGVSETVLGDQTSLCVISNGAECIMLHRSLYLQHAPDMLLQRLQIQCCPYPSEEQLQDQLQTSVDWQAFKHNTLQHTLDWVKSQRS